LQGRISLTIPRSFSRLLAYEASRILFRLGCDVRVFDPAGLPIKDDVQHDHPKVQELRELSKWSDGHIWVCPEQHGNLVSPLTLSVGMNSKTQISISPLDGSIQKPD
jgi:arsenic resistance protein ArsH